MRDEKHNWRKCGAYAKDGFEGEIRKEIDYIPTAEQIELRRAAEKAEAERMNAQRQEEFRIKRIKDAGPKLLTALKSARAWVMTENFSVPLIEEIDAAIKEAEGV